MRRIFGLAVAVFIAIGVLSAPAARAATFISVVATGTVTDSNDPGIVGATMSLEQRFKVDPALLFPDPANAVALFQTLQVSVTLGSSTSAFAGTGAPMDFGIYAISKLDVPGSVPASVNAQSAVEIFGGSMVLLANAGVQSASDDFVATTNLLQNFVFPPFPASGQASFGFSMQDTEGNVVYYAAATEITSLTVTVREVTIPAPAGFGLLAFGLAGLIITRRHHLAR